MSDTNLDKCFWVYPDSATAVPPGSAHALETENYHNRLELLVFPGERIRLPGVDGHPIDKRVRKRRKQYQSS